MSERIRIRDVRVLSDDWYLLKKTTFDFRRSNGSWQTVTRETYDRGNGAVILLVNSRKRTSFSPVNSAIRHSSTA